MPCRKLLRESFFADHGFTLVEVLVTVSILFIVMVPTMHVFTTAFIGAEETEESAVLTQHARAKMEEMMAIHFGDIPVGSPLSAPYSDMVSFRCRDYLRQVSVRLVDGESPGESGFGTIDTALKEVTVSINDIVLVSLKTDF